MTPEDFDPATGAPTPTPVEPSADMRSAAHQLREWFLAMIEQGFTEHQATGIIGAVLGQGMNNGESDQ